MKTLRVIICALFVLCCGALFTACGKEDFNENKMLLGLTRFEYDGEAHAVEVMYGNEDIDVTYSTSKNGKFKSLKKLNLVDAGTYNIYYKVSADGYNDYVSKRPVEVIIAKKDFRVSIFDFNLIKSAPNTNIQLAHSYIGHIEGDEMGLEFVFDEDFDRTNLEYGQSYEVGCTITNDNYNLIIERMGAIQVTDRVEITRGETTNYYPTLAAAVEDAQENETIYLNSDVEVTEGITVNKSLTVDGRGSYSVRALPDFAEAQMGNKKLSSIFSINNSQVELELTNLTVDGGKVARGVSVFAGKLTIDGTTITNGKKTDNFRSGGVYITNAASFEMKGGYIGNNDPTDEEYTRYCADLWIGANAVGSLVSITGGKVDNVFINSNEYSATNPGCFILEGGEIVNAYVEYDSGYGATLDYRYGNVDNLLVSTMTCGEYVRVSLPKEATVIQGGVIGTETIVDPETSVVTIVGYTDPVEMLSNASAENKITLYIGDGVSFANYMQYANEVVLTRDITISGQVEIANTVVVDGQGKYTIKTNENFSAANMLLVQTGDIEVTLKDVTLDAQEKARVIKISAGTLNVAGATITNGKSSSYVGGVFVTAQANFVMTGGSIKGNKCTNESAYYDKYSADLWIGSNAQGTVMSISGGEVGYVFVNSNSYASVNDYDYAGKFVLDGGTIDNVYVEYEDSYGGRFEFKNGVVTTLRLSTTNTGTFQEISNPNTATYNGGEGVVAE